jgi:hypothetical protein
MRVSTANPSVRCLTSLSRTPQDFDYCPCGRTPELQFVGRLTALNSVLNIIKVLPNNIDCPVTVPVDEASSGDPGNTVHGIRVGAESLRQVKLTIMHTRSSPHCSNLALIGALYASTFFDVLGSRSTMKNTS